MHQRLLIVDQNLKGFEGHHHDYSKCVIEAAKSVGVEPLLVCHEEFPANNLSGAPIVDRFSYGFKESGQSTITSVLRSALTKAPAPLRQSLMGITPKPPPSTPREQSDPRLAQWLLKLVSDKALSESDHVFIHTLSVAEFLGFAEVLSERPLLRPRLHIILRYDGVESYRAAFEKLQNSGMPPCFWTDTKQLAEQHRELGCRKIGVLPIPHGLKEITRRSPQEGEPLTLSYLGGARRDKGFHLLPGLVEALRDEFLETGRVRFLVQASYGVSREERLMAHAHRKLTRYPRKWVELIETAQNSHDFEKALLSTDILLLPYDQEVYRRRSSGLLVQAMVAGIPTVIPDGTWLAAEAPEGACATFGGELTFTNAVRSAIEDQEKLAYAGQAAMDETQSKHYIKKLLERLYNSP